MKEIQKDKLTPLIQQYFAIKERYHDMLLFFQVGDFYELFFDDAKKASAFLGIALTKRGTCNGKPVPLCGVPIHAVDHYLSKLIRGGFKVAVCDQLEEPKPGKVVERGVTQVFTPGTLTDSNLLDEKSASYLFSFFPTEKQWGLLFGELLTAQLFATILPSTSQKLLDAELSRFFPDEIILPALQNVHSLHSFFRQRGYFISVMPFDSYDKQLLENTQQWVQRQFKPEVYAQLEANHTLLLSFSLFHHYLKKYQEVALAQFSTVNFYQPDDYLFLDAATQSNLELLKNSQDGGRKNTLFAVLDSAVTSMGSRMIKKWLVRPLVNQEAIEQRLDSVEIILQHIVLMQQLEELLSKIGDIERIVGRITLGRAGVNDYLLICNALSYIPALKQLLQSHGQNSLLVSIAVSMQNFTTLIQLLKAALNDDSDQARIIKRGFDKYLDELCDLVEHGNQQFIMLEQREQKKTGIASLKVGYNQVHGYYIEVTKPNLRLVPDYYIRRQTLSGKERFITQELQEFEHKVLAARSEIETVEKEVFDRVKREVLLYSNGLRKLSWAISHLDALLGFARVAYNNGYIRPTFNDRCDIIIKAGRHPVVERVLTANFISNDVQLTNEESLWIVTGPNMGGKSTYLRQVALICIMAQCGSFVPAKEAHLALLDRIFTRIGAGDNVAEGKSTFLVEMEETATICTQATPNSLVILDEVGRGTSTFDGLALAQAVVEYIYKVIQAKCLFATHYHELTLLKDYFPGIVSYYAASKKTSKGVLFLYTITKGVADGSFGIEVAKLAQLPEAVIKRAQEVLWVLTTAEEHQSEAIVGSLGSLKKDRKTKVKKEDNVVFSGAYEQLMQENSDLKASVGKICEKIKQYERRIALLEKIDFDELSPKQAFDLLWRFKEGSG
ncbi:DNA mismatch repair protein MutS [Candidatus Dependentiae bacterium]|nr:MAG: DNA mismatch repair protein MutS [Candidatus Dependentiae bacterium]